MKQRPTMDNILCYELAGMQQNPPIIVTPHFFKLPTMDIKLNIQHEDVELKKIQCAMNVITKQFEFEGINTFHLRVITHETLQVLEQLRSTIKTPPVFSDEALCLKENKTNALSN